MSKELDWQRYHQLLDIKARRAFTTREAEEYAVFEPVVERIHAEEYERGRPALESYVAGHEKNLKELDRVITALEQKFGIPPPMGRVDEILTDMSLTLEDGPTLRHAAIGAVLGLPE